MFGALSYIGYVVYEQKGFNEAFAKAWEAIFYNHLYLVPLVLLMVLNWMLEGVKWKSLLKPVKKVSLLKAVTAVISGISLSFITVGGLGDYLGRALFIEKKHLKSLIGITLAGGIYQNLITYTAGGAGLILFLEFQLGEVFQGLWFLLFGLFAVLVYFVFHIHYLLKIKFLRQFISTLASYNTKDKFFIFLLSFCRYVIILIQYFLILQALQVQIGILDFFTGISLMLLLKSAIPRFSFLSDLGIREFSALLFFTKVGLAPAIIISSTLLLWVLNILIPAVGGLYFILGKK